MIKTNNMNKKGVYILTSPSGKQYVGITSVSFKRRLFEHKNNSIKGTKNKLYEAIRKYGFDNFNVDMYELPNNWEIMCEVEKTLIKELDTFNNGYNLTLGGEGSYGYKPTKETIEKLKHIHSTRTRNEMPQHQKDAIRNSLKGRKLSEKHRENISKGGMGKVGKKGFKHSLDTIEKMKNRIPWCKGLKMTDDFRKKVSEARKGYIMSQQEKDKRSKTQGTSIYSECVECGSNENFSSIRQFSKKYNARISLAMLKDSVVLKGKCNCGGNLLLTCQSR